MKTDNHNTYYTTYMPHIYSYLLRCSFIASRMDTAVCWVVDECEGV